MNINLKENKMGNKWIIMITLIMLLTTLLFMYVNYMGGNYKIAICCGFASGWVSILDGK